MYRLISIFLLLFSSPAALFALDTSLKADTLPKFTALTLQERGYTDHNLSLVNSAQITTFATLKTANVCKVLPTKFSSTIYNIDLAKGVVTCMFAEVGNAQVPSNLYYPIGLYDIQIPALKAHYAYTQDASALTAQLTQADALFSTLKQKKEDLINSLEDQSATFVNIPQIILAALIQDSDIIDVQASSATGKLHLNQGYTSKFTENGENKSNEDIILVDTNTMFSVYAKLGELSVWYLMLLVALFGGAALSKYGVQYLSSKLEKKQTSKPSTPFYIGMLFSLVFFFPTEDAVNNMDDYSLLKTNFQTLEKVGYYTFNDWANDSAKVIIDAEIDAIIAKSGIGTREQIIGAYAGQMEHQKKKEFYSDNLELCKYVYSFDSLKKWTLYAGEGYGLNNENLFPPSEVHAANAFFKHGRAPAYYHLSDDETYDGLLPGNAVAAPGEYPLVSFSQCSKAQDNYEYHTELHQAHNDQLRGLLTFDSNEGGKVAILEKIVEFQYELYRDWGYLAILGLPITKMQTEYIGGLYSDPTSQTVKALQKKLAEGSGSDYSIMSSIPYLLLPGAGTVYDVISDNTSTFGGVLGTVSGGPIGGFFGAVVGKLFGGAIALPVAYQTAKTFLDVAPIVALVAIGILRYIVIIAKIFVLHIASLFVLPLMFARQNLEAISNFAMKIVTMMLELPLFVLSIWLAITVHSLIKSIGGVLSKELMIGMLENSDVQYANSENLNGFAGYINQLKIFFFDGIIEIAIALFSIVIIYKIITSLHTMVFELLDLNSPKALDNAIDSMRRESENKI